METNSQLKRYLALLMVIIVPSALVVAWLRTATMQSPKANLAQGGVATPSPAAASPSPAQSSATTVTIDNFTFTPKVITVTAGTTVQWINRDDIPHVVASADDKFKKSPALDTDDSFSHTFSEPGTYEYYCSIHPRMTGTVVVKAPDNPNK